jgi:hypothetical protein
MNKAVRKTPAPDMLDEYDFSQGVRGKYAKRYAQGTNIVILAPDVAEFFPDSESVNAALRALVGVAQENVRKVAVGTGCCIVEHRDSCPAPAGRPERVRGGHRFVAGRGPAGDISRRPPWG